MNASLSRASTENGDSPTHIVHLQPDYCTRHTLHDWQVTRLQNARTSEEMKAHLAAVGGVDCIIDIRGVASQFLQHLA